MSRNLGIGNVGEVFFRYWYETNCSGLDDIALRQFGYNPEGVVVGEKKVAMLKRLERSSDFALYSHDELHKGPKDAKPLLGISINTQRNPFSMTESRSPKFVRKEEVAGCYNCPNGAACFKGEEERLWYNEYNIKNDYKLFHDEFGKDIFLVTIISRIPNNVFNSAIKKKRYNEELRTYLINGQDSINHNPEIVDFLDYLLFDQRYKNRTKMREYELVWIKYSDIMQGAIPYHITGAPVNIGRPRPVACISKEHANSERTLVEAIEKMSKHKIVSRSKTWYVASAAQTIDSYK